MLCASSNTNAKREIRQYKEKDASVVITRQGQTGMGLTHSLDTEASHDLVPKFAAKLPELGDGQVLQQPWDRRHGDQGLLGRLVHSRRQLGQYLHARYMLYVALCD